MSAPVPVIGMVVSMTATVFWPWIAAKRRHRDLPAEPLTHCSVRWPHIKAITLIPKLLVAWRKNSRAQKMAKQRVAVVDEADRAVDLRHAARPSLIRRADQRSRTASQK